MGKRKESKAEKNARKKSMKAANKGMEKIFSTYAKERMSERSISAKMVEQAMKEGTVQRDKFEPAHNRVVDLFDVHNENSSLHGIRVVVSKERNEQGQIQTKIFNSYWKRGTENWSRFDGGRFDKGV